MNTHKKIQVINKLISFDFTFMHKRIYIYLASIPVLLSSLTVFASDPKIFVPKDLSPIVSVKDDTMLISTVYWVCDSPDSYLGDTLGVYCLENCGEGFYRAIPANNDIPKPFDGMSVSRIEREHLCNDSIAIWISTPYYRKDYIKLKLVSDTGVYEMRRETDQYVAMIPMAAESISIDITPYKYLSSISNVSGVYVGMMKFTSPGIHVAFEEGSKPASIYITLPKVNAAIFEEWCVPDSYVSIQDYGLEWLGYFYKASDFYNGTTLMKQLRNTKQ